MRTSWGYPLILTYAWAYGCPFAAQATTFFQRPFEDRVKDAPALVRGTVGMAYSDWGKDNEGTQRIYTYTELSVEEVLRGPETLRNKRQIIVREPGGEKEGKGMRVVGVAEFKRGEDVVLMIDAVPAQEGAYPVHGMMMGKYDVVRDPNGGEDRISGPGLNMGGGGGVVDDHGHGGNHENAPRVTWTLSQLRSLIAQQSGISPKSPPAPEAPKTPLPKNDSSQPSPQVPTEPEEASSTASKDRRTYLAIAGVLMLSAIIKRALRKSRARQTP